MKIFGLLLLSSLVLNAVDLDAIIQKAEDNTRGTNLYNKITMKIKSNRSERMMKMESWSEGGEKSYIRINYPKKDKGITFLKLDNQMWQYVPKIEKVIKIPASMMMQSWMGSDFSNDDMVKESSMSKDYNKKLLSEDANAYTIELIPKEDATVVWGKLILVIQKNTYVALKTDYYDDEGVLERSMYFTDIKKIGSRYFPFTMTIQPQSEDKKQNTTTIIMDEVNFNPKFNQGLFTKRALTRYSK